MFDAESASWFRRDPSNLFLKGRRDLGVPPMDDFQNRVIARLFRQGCFHDLVTEVLG